MRTVGDVWVPAFTREILIQEHTSTIFANTVGEKCVGMGPVGEGREAGVNSE